ncbi:putative Peptidyl-prolyl cis-trans isomerase CYP21-4 [Cocos nucifera]|uniref:Peptidyl-prolyl cis-trans isomerase n=1 Tax=Cocos nucifera TaxID=13894 RepID=A0A8K0IWN7_COCNU|nr:putative Peptidyl-prolyl cis-trans isomerase CYP21-4 [Cocos nucifera]
MELYKDASPDIVAKFVELCQNGYFKGMPFHHVIKNYVIQGGDSQRLGTVEDWILKGKSHGQLPISPKHEAFMIGTTRANPDDKGFELFITTAPIPDLNDKLAVFGRVVKAYNDLLLTDIYYN